MVRGLLVVSVLLVCRLLRMINRLRFSSISNWLRDWNGLRDRDWNWNLLFVDDGLSFLEKRDRDGKREWNCKEILKKGRDFVRIGFIGIDFFVT